jgi:alkylation response protein AidB-like acyl-CoA dehydrogenase
VRRAALLGTRYTMTLPFWRDRLRDRFGVELLVPGEADREVVHGVIYDELVRGRIEPASRAAYAAIIARLADAGADPKVVHAKASMAKLFVSEAAGRCADRAVQAFGGRGYRRDNVTERFWRELRVDRIWEGTSEIQRLIVARALERRGVERVVR